MEAENITTCQICGRVIKSKNGVIAHHGYTRPDSGWQTASCMGARHLPYEISCDILPLAIEKVIKYIDNTKKDLIDFVENPPLTLKCKAYNDKSLRDYNKPEDFNEKLKFSLSMRDTYMLEYTHKKYSMETSIKQSEKDVLYFQDRLNNWRKQ